MREQRIGRQDLHRRLSDLEQEMTAHISVDRPSFQPGKPASPWAELQGASCAAIPGHENR